MTEQRHGPIATDSAARGSPAHRAWIGLAAAALVYLALRGAILWTNFDSVALWAYELFMCGTVGRALLGGGGDIPLPYYYDNAAGPVLMGFAVAPFYAALGPSYLVLKLVSLTLGLGALVLAWLVLRRLFGVRTAHLGAFVLALAPATSTKYALIAAGNHSENLFFSMLATWSFVELHSRPRSRAWLVATGLFAGWSLTIFVGALIPLALLALVHFGLRGWRKALGDLPWTLAGFAVGLAPLVWLNLGAAGRGLGFLAAKFGGGGGGAGFDAGRFADRIGEFLGVHLVQASTYPDFLGLPGRVADVLFLAATVAAFAVSVPIALRALAGFWKRQRSGAVLPVAPAELAEGIVFVLAAYLPLAAVAFGLSNLKIAEVRSPVIADGYRYFLPHFQNSMLLIAIATGTLLASRRAADRIAAPAIAGAALVAGAFDLALIRVDPRGFGAGLRYEGHNFAQNARLLLNKTLGLDEARRIELAETRFDPMFRSRLDYGVGYYRAMEQALKPRGGELDLAKLVAPLATDATVLAESQGDPSTVAELRVRRADAARGVGTLLRARQTGPGVLRPDDVERLAGWIEGGAPFAENAAEGACLEWGLTTWIRTDELLDASLRIVSEAPPVSRRALARGFGIACGRILRRDIEGDAERVRARSARLAPELLVDFQTGVGIGLADGHEHPRLVAEAARALPADAIDVVLAAFDARVREVFGEAAPERSSLADPDLPEEWRERWSRLASH